MLVQGDATRDRAVAKFRRATWSMIATGVLACAVTSESQAQATAAAAVVLGGIDKLLERIESINLYTGGQLDNRLERTTWNRSFGIEFGFNAGSAWVVDKKNVAYDTTVTTWTVKKHLDRKPGGFIRRPPDNTVIADTGLSSTLVSIDTEAVHTRTKKEQPHRIDFQLGLAYGQLDGLKAPEGYEVRGYVRELPAVSLYATLHPFVKAGVDLPVDFSVYVGQRFGIASLQDVQLFTKNPENPLVSITATTFESGVPIGAELTFGGSLTLTVEFTSMRRNFSSLSYNPVAKLPDDIMHSLNVSGRSIDFGFSVQLPQTKK